MKWYRSDPYTKTETYLTGDPFLVPYLCLLYHYNRGEERSGTKTLRRRVCPFIENTRVFTLLYVLLKQQQESHPTLWVVYP